MFRLVVNHDFRCFCFIFYDVLWVIFSITQLHARIDATNDRKARIERELQDCNDSLSQLQDTQQQPNEPTDSTASQKNQYVM